MKQQENKVAFPSELNDIINDRGHVWDAYDQALRQKEDFEFLAKKVAHQGTATTISPLTSSQNPPDEIGAVIRDMSSRFDSISSAEGEISRHEDEIKQIKNRVATAIAGAVVLGLIGIVIFATVITTLIRNLF